MARDQPVTQRSDKFVVLGQRGSPLPEGLIRNRSLSTWTENYQYMLSEGKKFEKGEEG